MSEIHRFSSRRQRLDHAFLGVRLKEAKSYTRDRSSLQAGRLA